VMEISLSRRKGLSCVCLAELMGRVCYHIGFPCRQVKIVV